MRGMQGLPVQRSWIDEALFPAPRQEDHRWYDHLFAADENLENHWLFGTDQKTLEVWWCWSWLTLEFGVGLDVERSREPMTPWLNAWVNFGFLAFGISLKRPGWKRRLR